MKVDWPKLDARAANIKIDVLRGHCTASDPTGAIVQLPDGRTLRSAWAFVNYKTWSFRTGASSVVQPMPSTADVNANGPGAVNRIAPATSILGQEGQL